MIIVTANLNRNQVARFFYKAKPVYLTEEHKEAVYGSEYNTLMYKDQNGGLTDPEIKRKDEIENTLVQPKYHVYKIEILDVSDKPIDKIKNIMELGRSEFDTVVKELEKIENTELPKIPYKDIDTLS